MNMNKYSVFFFLALLALAYGQSAKAIPADSGSQDDTLPAKNVNSDSSAAKTSKAPPSEFLASATANGTKLPPTETAEASVTKATVSGTKTVPPELLTSAAAATGATAGAAAAGASPTTTVNGSMNAGNSTESSSATKVAGTFVASVVAFIMALY